MAPKPTYEELEKENLRLKASVDELRTYQEKYWAIFNHGFNCLYIHDLEGNFLEANDAALKLLGYEREEIFDINFASLIGEDQLPKAFETLEEIKRTGYESKVVEYELKRKDGSCIWIDTGGSLIYEKGIPRAILGVAEPIEEVILTQRIYLDGLTKDAFIQRFLTVRNAVIAVIWSTIKDLMDVKPPAESTEKTKH